MLLDGADISQFTRTQLAKWIGYVPQECVLFTGTIRDNITHCRPDAADDDVIAVAKAVGIHAFIVNLPDGYGTEVGELGVRLSAGQRQRVAIARALINDPSVLLLDEPSSNLDRQAEQDLRDVLVRLGSERTVIMVTHSATLLSSCETVIGLQNGKVALAGSAEEVLPRLMASVPMRQEARSAPPRKFPGETKGQGL